MAESLSDVRLAAFSDLSLVSQDRFGQVYEGKRQADKSRVLIRLLDGPSDVEALKAAIEAVDKEDFLAQIEVIDGSLLVTDLGDFVRLSELNKADEDRTLPMAEFEALSIVGSVFPKILKAEKSQLSIFNLRPSNLFVKQIVQGRPSEGQSTHVLKIGEPYQHALFQAAESVSDPYVAQNFKVSNENLHSHSLGCMMYHLVFGEPMGRSQQDNKSISYLYSHYMFQLTKTSPRERLSLSGFERSQRTFKECEALVIYPTARVINLLTSRGYYTGEIRYGMMHGRGAFSANKDSYMGLDVAATEGFFCLDKLHLRGTIIYRCGDRYEGGVQWDSPHGEGTLLKLSGTTIRGDWEGSHLVEESEGEISIPDYSCYRGQVSKNQPNGAGLMVYNDGLVYKGEFKIGQRHGTGHMYRKSGDKVVYSYSGAWYENEKHGEAEEISDNVRFKGTFHMGKKHGHGHMEDISNDGWTYDGEFKQDQFHGLGMLTKNDGEKYTGEFKNGKRHGFGCCEFTDGSIYDGQWENDKPHGEGCMTDVEGSTTNGVWLNGEQVEFDD